MMKLYNTLSKTIDEIEPQNAPVVTVYTCGPTVYDFPHIGNWFTYLREDILIRVLQSEGLQPHWVMNITDVGHLVSDGDDGEDKLEKGARREGKTAWDVAEYYTQYFLQSLERLNILTPTNITKATEHIEDQIALVKTLEDKGYTYVTSDGVYFDTSKFPEYGDFARLDVDEQQAGARVEYNPEKRQPTDFALWKFSPSTHQRDMEWDSPWGKGFPGWHIECSAMSMKYLGATLDIHAGGIDHIPVHHTNEIAQSQAATGQPFARHWLHANHITIEGDKISKSLGNGITLEDIETAQISLQAFRMHVLESHYRSQSKFSWESLQASQSRLKRWQAMADLRWQATVGNASVDIRQKAREFSAALSHDLDTPKALFIIDELFSQIEQTGLADIDSFTEILKLIDSNLGINLLHPDIPANIKQTIQDRLTARANKDWANSDELRETIALAGYGLRDSGDTTIWYRL